MAEPEHRVEVEDLPYAFVAVCSCGWMGGDHPTDRGQAEDDARMHERGELHSWQVPPGENREWTPERNRS